MTDSDTIPEFPDVPLHSKLAYVVPMFISGLVFIGAAGFMGYLVAVYAAATVANIGTHPLVLVKGTMMVLFGLAAIAVSLAGIYFTWGPLFQTYQSYYGAKSVPPGDTDE